MNILHFRTLVAVHDAPTFADAAEALYLTPAAVSQQMRHLEETLQVALFDRATRPPRLNAHGLRVVAHARDVLVSYDRLVEIAGAVDEIAGVLTIGAATGITSRLIPAMLRRLRDNYPALQIKIEEGVTTDLISRVRRRSLDAAVITEPDIPEPDLVTLPITSEQMMVLAPVDSEENDWKSLIASRPFLRLNRLSGVGRLIDAEIRKARIPVQEAMELDSSESIVDLVTEGLGIGVVPAGRVTDDVRKSLKVVPFGSPPVMRNVVLIERTNNQRSDLANILYQELRALTAKPKKKA
jgi:DNA-binding transcriptional LysR family regulator